MFRPSSPADGPALAAFLADAFKDDPAHPPHDAAQFHWKYWMPREDWPGGRSFVLERGGRIIAHAGVIPGRCAWQGGRLDTLHLIEWAALPGALGAGGTVLKQIARMSDALLAIGGNARTLAMLPALGFRSCGEATPFVRSVRPFKLMQGSAPSWRVAVKVARGVLWKFGTSASVDPQWRATRVSPEALDATALPSPAPRGREAVLERSVAMFRYLMACPATPMALYRVERVEARVIGYFVLAFAPGQARLADCWVDSPNEEDWCAAIQLAVRAATEDPGVAEVAALSSDPLLSSALTRCGFRARPTQTIQMLAKGDAWPAFEGLRVHLVDNDAAWLHAGRVSP